MSSQGTVDALGALDGENRRTQIRIDAIWVSFALHLREEHGWSRRRVARHLTVREKWVRDNVDILLKKRG